MNLSRPLLALALLGCTSLAYAAPNCSIKLKGDDRMQFDQKEITVSASCATITVDFEHTGKLPVKVMGHNVVIVPTPDLSAVSADGMKAGAPAYLPKGDARVVVATDMIGGGQKTSTKFSGKKLKAGGDYTFFCSFPGHVGIMKGKLVVTK